MTPNASLKAQLATDVTAVSGRVYPVIGPSEPTYPFITYKLRRIAAESDLADATGDESNGEIEVHAWSDDPDQVETVAESVYNSLHGFQGELGGSGGINVRHIYFNEDEPDFGLPAGVADTEHGAFVNISFFDLLYDR